MVARRVAIWVGGLALLAATLIDTLAVIGRHIGMPLTGSIELMQAAILVSGSLGLVIATGEQMHARVRLVIDRLGERWRSGADIASDVLTLVFFLAMLTGSAWLAADLWAGHEQSELLGVSWRALRLAANASLLAACAILAWRLVGRRP
jgi:TRAP-type C4-dicarboxylate transport system permease small subunit